ncbi:hypothetical protein B0H16DRAFT_1474373 [Mycena metata]|uniref:Uncharacterized protein n=1 Tax=Mycena metata TaxID=1033252 RepID=A0AAD7HGZ9_9AGAR|nr:hypothetical protein B0H16DRAFT_1474373 [Mycena metata]
MSAPIQTAAEKRKATIAAKAAKELEDNVAFQNESIWKDDLLPITRKRTSSTQSAGPAKKARATAGESSDEEDEEEPAPKPKTKARRAHPAPSIDIDTDSESELAAAPAPKKPAMNVRLDLTKLPVKTAKKTKTSSAAQPAKSTSYGPNNVKSYGLGHKTQCTRAAVRHQHGLFSVLSHALRHRIAPPGIVAAHRKLPINRFKNAFIYLAAFPVDLHLRTVSKQKRA